MENITAELGCENSSVQSNNLECSEYDLGEKQLSVCKWGYDVHDGPLTWYKRKVC